MIRPQYEELAELLINHSCSLEKGENVLIEAFDIPEEMVIATIRAARKAGGYPFVTWKNNLILKELISDISEIFRLPLRPMYASIFSILNFSTDPIRSI